MIAAWILNLVLSGLPLLDAGLVYLLSEFEPDPEAIAREYWKAQPQQPPFGDPIAPESPNAAGRYMWLAREIPKELATAAGWVEGDFSRLSLMAPDESGITVERAERLLRDHQDWIRSIIAASELDICTTYRVSDPRFSPRLPSDDPRDEYLGRWRKMLRVVRMDAIRCAVSRDHDQAIERLIAMVRMSRQLARSRETIITGLVADAGMRMGLASIEKFINQTTLSLTADQLRKLEAAVADLDPADPSGVRAVWCDGSRRMAEFIDEQTCNGAVGMTLQISLGEMLGARAISASLAKWLEAAAKPSKDRRAGAATGQADNPMSVDDQTIEEVVGEALPLMSAPSIRARLAAARDAASQLERGWDGPDGEALAGKASELEDADPSGASTLVLAGAKSVHRQWREVVRAREQTLQTIHDRLSATDAPK